MPQEEYLILLGNGKSIKDESHLRLGEPGASPTGVDGIGYFGIK
jgi:hypothetical protein